MYNRFYMYLKEDKVHYEKKFGFPSSSGFQSGYSTNDAIVQLVDKIFYPFEKKKQFSVGFFIDLSKAFAQLIIPSYLEN